MKNLALLFLLIILGGCALQNTEKNQDSKRDQNGLLIPNADGSIPVPKDKQGLVGQTQEISKESTPDESGKLWMETVQKNHPNWKDCVQDYECVSVSTDCGSVCRGDALNSKFYSDYVTEHSSFCTGYGRTIKQCPYTEKFCENGKCKLKNMGN